MTIYLPVGQSNIGVNTPVGRWAPFFSSHCVQYTDACFKNHSLNTAEDLLNILDLEE